ncbi:uncharacterized protein EDB93DRAFT_1245873 [Suillus bovinus]|uniref:uncharacterized protein n=1 Tax=Suillus bovinus TaxID=48563 RepID=UPI001B86D7CA|nr:uncharacterized protein EDB93DRAFT_1245873 [Suillus bovinus]KAG2158641.1 hypothetical protein EDB93DRAFT_1245873 [Suillus bovinus]
MDEVSTWATSTLDQVNFLPLNHEHSFGFLDSTDVLRGCHVIPRFARGKRHADGLGVSACAGDKDDWCEYYVNRFIDCDMLMRFHFRLGIGHASFNCDVEDLTDDVEVDEDEGDDESDDTDDGLDIEQPFSSNKSLPDQFNEMYDGEVDLDYEN